MNKEKQQVFERVRVEYDELREKIGKLKDFLKSEKIKQIDTTQAYLLRIQYETMTAYANILEKRLALYEEESKTTGFN
jgi:hypothetical protein